jgi:hypothetical protein
MKNELFTVINLPVKVGAFYIGTNLNFRIQKYESFGSYSSLMSNIYFGYKGINLNFLVNTSSAGKDIYKYRYTSYLLRTSMSIIKGLYGSIYTEYQENSKRFSNISAYINKRIFYNWDLSFNYSRNYLSGLSEFNVALRLNFSSMNWQANVSHGGSSFSGIQGFGSLIYDPVLNNFYFNRNSSINRGSAFFIPFFDVNRNGIKEEDEEIIEKSPMIIAERGYLISDRNNSFLVELEGYEDSYITLDKYNEFTVNSNDRYLFTPYPNMINRFYIPVESFSEVSGSIKGMEDKKNDCFKLNLRLINTITGEIFLPEIFSNGDFSFKNIKNGNYLIKIDSIENDTVVFRPLPKEIALLVSSREAENIYEGNLFYIEKIFLPEKSLVKVASDTLKNNADLFLKDKKVFSDIPILKNISFSLLKRPSKSLINYLYSVAKLLKNNSSYKIVIEAYTDNSGEFMDKLKRSLVIIDKTKKILFDYGVPNNKIIGIPFNDSRPICSNLTPEGRERNNRIILRLILSK